MSEKSSTLIAAGIFLLVIVCGWLLMPRLMLFISPGGPLAGVAVAILFMLAFFAILWLRARHQRRPNKD
jgi:hypothetical protein